jgi:hypothetical protein
MHEEEVCLFPGMPLILFACPFGFKRLQFLVKQNFAMVINKAEDKSLKGVCNDKRGICFIFMACS